MSQSIGLATTYVDPNLVFLSLICRGLFKLSSVWSASRFIAPVFSTASRSKDFERGFAFTGTVTMLVNSIRLAS